MINRDFTLHKYRMLCESVVKSDYVPTTVRDHIRNPLASAIVIMRHDVDRKIDTALEMARLEHSMGIKATYYFRKTPQVFKSEIIKQIKKMGHEIGYHYEVLDKAKGNKELAIRLFEQELEEFRSISDIETICMHGNPLSRWTNLDLWYTYDFRDFGIIGEAYLSIDYSKILYLTDTGRSWNNSWCSVKDITIGNSRNINSTDDIISLIRNRGVEQICISTHPNRWNDNIGAWLMELLWQNIKNTGKAGLVWYRNGIR